MNRLDELLTAISKGQPIENWESFNRLEQYLICILTRKGIEDMGEPMNRLEELLQAVYLVVPENAIEILRIDLEKLEQ